MKTIEVIKQLLLQMSSEDPKDEALKCAIITILNKSETKSEAKTEEPKKRGRPAGSKSKKPFDIGKAKACREAGWSIAKIADEMRVSTSTVSTKLKEAGVKIPVVLDA